MAHVRESESNPYLVVPPDLADEIRERLVDIDALLGGRLDEAAVEVLREVATLCH